MTLVLSPLPISVRNKNAWRLLEITTFDKQTKFITNINVDFMQPTEKVSQTIILEKIIAIVKKTNSLLLLDCNQKRLKMMS